MTDHSKAQDPQRMAQLELTAAYGSDTDGLSGAAYHLARAQVFATLALVDAMREVSDRLDSIPRGDAA